MRLDRSGYSPYSLAWQMAAVPRTPALRAIILKGFANFVSSRTAVMRRRQFRYNATIVRSDGNHKLGRRIWEKDAGRPYNAVLAVCGLDGSLLEPPLPIES